MVQQNRKMAHTHTREKKRNIVRIFFQNCFHWVREVFALVNVHTRKKKKKMKLKHKEDTWQEFSFSKLFMLGKSTTLLTLQKLEPIRVVPYPIHTKEQQIKEEKKKEAHTLAFP